MRSSTRLSSRLAQSYSPEPSGQEPVDAGLLTLAALLQAYGHVGDRDAVALTVMDKRWQLVLDCLGAEHPPFSQGTLCSFRMQLIAHNLDKTLLDRTVALAEHTGGFGARQLRAVWTPPPLFGAGRVEDTWNLLGHALRKAVDAAAQKLGISALGGRGGRRADAGGPRQSQSRTGPGLGRTPCACLRVGPGPGGGARWQHWLEQQPTLAAQEPPLKEGMETITQMITQDTEPDPEEDLEEAHQEARRACPAHLARDTDMAVTATKSSAKTFNGFKKALCGGSG